MEPTKYTVVAHVEIELESGAEEPLDIIGPVKGRIAKALRNTFENDERGAILESVDGTARVGLIESMTAVAFDVYDAEGRRVAATGPDLDA